MLTTNFSKTTLGKLLKFCQCKCLVMIFVKTEKQGRKNKPHFLIGVVIEL